MTKGQCRRAVPTGDAAIDWREDGRMIYKVALRPSEETPTVTSVRVEAAEVAEESAAAAETTVEPEAPAEPAAEAPAAQELEKVARALGHRARGLAGRSLGLSPAGR